MRTELKEECDYEREGSAMRTFRSHLKSDTDSKRYRVPWVWEASTKDVLVMERLNGIPLGEESIRMADQGVRNEVRESDFE